MKLRKIRHDLQPEINKVIQDLVRNTEYSIEGIQGYIANIKRGRAYPDGRFTVPLWAYTQKQENGHPLQGNRNNCGYFIYYVAHELTHQLQSKKYSTGNHDFRFYEIFMTICPKEYQYFELNYIKTSSKYGIKL